MEKKTEVTTTKGYKIKVASHMLSDLAKFGATQNRPSKKETPEELLRIPAKKIIMPGLKEVNPLPEMKATIPSATNPEPPVEKPKRKPPVRSKSSK